MTTEFLPVEEERLDEVEGHDVITLPLCHAPCSWTEGDAKLESILDFGAQGFLLRNLMSQEECRHYMAAADAAGFQAMDGVKKSYRNCTRIIAECKDLGESLFARVRPFLGDELVIDGDARSLHIHGMQSLLKGTWVPTRLNHLFRVCRYEPGGHFAPHFDGCLVVSAKERSMQTLMIYLNGDFTGGSTNFVDETQKLYQDAEGRYCAEDTNVLCRLQPEQGMAILFNHHRLHEGSKLEDGVKYILRTDILYRRVSGPEVSSEDERAMQLAQEAERLEARGENMEAMQLYRKAFKLSPMVEKSYSG